MFFQQLNCQYTYELAVCSVFQNEAPYLKEWIEFHRLVGVEHFYLYNNFSTDNFHEVLDPYIKSGIIELFDWNIKQKPNNTSFQTSGFNDALERVRGMIKWVAFLDIDEFLYPVQEDNLVEFLKDYEEFGGVCAQWVIFGTSDVGCIPKNKLMIECLINTDPKYITAVKSIVRPERVKRFDSPHIAIYKDGYYQVDANGRRFEGMYVPSYCLEKLRINHYWSRDIRNFLEVKIFQRLNRHTESEDHKKRLEFLEWTLKRMNDCKNGPIDKTIQKYVGKLRIACGLEHDE
jgi:hypothetical protein